MADPRKRFMILLIVIMVLISFAGFSKPVQDSLAYFLEFVKDLGATGVILFILVYIFATVLFLPSVILSIGAGFIYGTFFGTIYVEIGATVGACIAFLLGKAVFREFAQHLAESYPTFSAIDKAITFNSWKIVTLLRLSPVTPYNILNYSLALTRIEFWEYTWTSAIGMLPSTILFVYMGTAVKNISDIMNQETEYSFQKQLFFYGGLILTIVSVVVITVITGRAIQQELRAAEQKRSAIRQKTFLV